MRAPLTNLLDTKRFPASEFGFYTTFAGKSKIDRGFNVGEAGDCKRSCRV
jgi:hypothetical protein